MIFGLFRKNKPSRDTVEYGRYMNKPVLQRAVQYICSLDSETARKEIEEGNIRLNYRAATDCSERLHVGRYRLHYGDSIYLFYIS
jgi:hypothetical protein